MTFPSANEALARAIEHAETAPLALDYQLGNVHAQLATAWALIADHLVIRQVWEQEDPPSVGEHR